VRFGGWPLPTLPSGEAKALSAPLLGVWRGMSRQRGDAPGQARVSTRDDGSIDCGPPPRALGHVPRHTRQVYAVRFRRRCVGQTKMTQGDIRR
jgi:hypothetical protein